MNQLSTLVKPELPTTVEDLTKFVLVGREKLTAVRACIRAIDKLDVAKEVREQKKEEAQMLADALLDAEARIGEMLKELPKDNPNKRILISENSFNKPKMQVIKELGFDKTQASRFETLADNKDIIEQVKADAKENDDLPTRTEVLRRVKEKQREQRNEDLKTHAQELPTNIFQVIYCDPPWQYSNEGFAMSAENQYPTMSIEQLKELKINEIADKNSVMFMWATNPILKDAIELMGHWGFEYKTNIVWTKDRHTAGFYVFGKHELLLIGVKGSMLPIGKKPFSIITGENKIHSKKPYCTYEIIESMYPELKYVELFARNNRENWESWGNQV